MAFCPVSNKCPRGIPMRSNQLTRLEALQVRAKLGRCLVTIAGITSHRLSDDRCQFIWNTGLPSLERLGWCRGDFLHYLSGSVALIRRRTGKQVVKNCADRINVRRFFDLLP